jgi:hypothetical protein
MFIIHLGIIISQGYIVALPSTFQEADCRVYLSEKIAFKLVNVLFNKRSKTALKDICTPQQTNKRQIP